MAYSKEQKDTAALLWRLGANAQEIALELGLNSRWVVYKWAEDEKWDKALSTTALIVKTARRVNWLIEKAEKSEADYRELHQHKHTYFGAPTAISHPAYTIWSGERFTKYHPETQIEVSKHADLFYGRKDPDGFWRCVTTVDSAIEMGWDQVSLEHASLAVLSLPQAYHEKFRLFAKQRFRGLVAG